MGSWENESAADAALIKKFIIDTDKINQQPLAIQQNDASAYYDRIVAHYALLNSRREGTPTNVYKLRANALHITRYYVQITIGTYKKTTLINNILFMIQAKGLGQQKMNGVPLVFQ